MPGDNPPWLSVRSVCLPGVTALEKTRLTELLKRVYVDTLMSHKERMYGDGAEPANVFCLTVDSLADIIA